MTSCGSAAYGFLPIIPESELPLYLRPIEPDEGQMNNGVRLISAAHLPWYKRFLAWLRNPFARLNEDSLEDIEIEVRRD